PSDVRAHVTDVLKKPKSATYWAAQIYQFSVVDEAKRFVASFFDGKTRFLPPSVREPFASKIPLYSEASALRVLPTEQQNNARLEGLVAEFEKLILPPSPTVEGMTKLEAVKSAMSDLNRLFSEKKELSWARAWFTGIGHNETNPETLMVFVQLLGTNTKGLRQLTADIQSSMGE